MALAQEDIDQIQWLIKKVLSETPETLNAKNEERKKKGSGLAFCIGSDNDCYAKLTISIDRCILRRWVN